MFIDKEGSILVRLSKISDYADHFDLELLTNMCDSPHVVMGDNKNKTVINTVMFFMRTARNNLVVTIDNNCPTLFAKYGTQDWEKNLGEITLSDYMLLAAKEILTSHVFKDRNPQNIAAHVMPSPFGVTGDKRIALFQLIYNHESGLELCEPFSLIPIEKVDTSIPFQEQLVKQFIKTKE